MHRPLIIGLTGGIASGKSTVGRVFQALGVPLIDADQVARQVVEPGQPALKRIAQTFGQGVITADGRLDRAALRTIVFTDPGQRRQLEDILHPVIRQQISDWLAAQTAPYVILESPLLLETSQHQLVHRILLVDVPEALQVERTMARDGSSAEQAQAIIRAQMPAALRRQRAHDIIVNDTSMDTLKNHVADLHQVYLTLSASVSRDF